MHATIMDQPELVSSTGALLEQSMNALKLTGAVFPVAIRFQSCVRIQEVNEIPINPKLMKAERTYMTIVIYPDDTKVNIT